MIVTQSSLRHLLLAVRLFKLLKLPNWPALGTFGLNVTMCWHIDSVWMKSIRPETETETGLSDQTPVFTIHVFNAVLNAFKWVRFPWEAKSLDLQT